MHYWHNLLVKATTPEDAQLTVGRFLEDHKEGVWDFYNVGGRWTGIHGDDVIRVRGHEEMVRAAIEEQLAAQKTSLRQYQTRLADRSVELATLVTPQESYENGENPSAMAWAGDMLQLMGRLVGDDYCLESWFWDVEADCSYMTDGRWMEVVNEGDQYWLVTVDLHRQATP